MRETVYLETSFFSFYFDERPAPAIVARREWTHQWWTRRRRHYELLTSTAVLVLTCNDKRYLADREHVANCFSHYVW
jgi:hypothetical protein